MQNPFLSLDQRIVGDIYTSTSVMDVLTVLCDDLGPRFAGTPQEREAADYIADTWRSYGLSNVELEPYEYAGWTRGQATCAMTAPRERALDCISLPYCPAAEVTAEVVDVGMGTPTEYAAAAERIPGRIVVASSRTPARFGRWIHRKEKYQRAVAAGAAAFVFVGEVPGAGPETGSLQDDGEAPIPGISVGLEAGALIGRFAKRFGTVALHIATTDRNERRTSWNVVGELPGGEEPDALVMTGSHYDGHDIAQGAIDPASGTAAMIEAARVLATHASGRLRRTVRFVSWGTEEIGLIGSHRYAAAHADEWGRVCFYLNMDSAGALGRKGVVLHEWPELEPFFRSAIDEMAADVPVGQHVNSHSDHFPLLLRGVATGHMGDAWAGPKGRGWGHTRSDTLDKVFVSDLRDAASVCARVLLRVACAPDFPTLSRSPAQVESLIATHRNLEAVRVGRSLRESM